MAEVGLLPFARVALEVAKEVLASVPQPFQQASTKADEVCVDRGL